MEGNTITFPDGDSAGTKFANPTEKPFNAKALVIRYVDDRYSSIEVYEVSNREEKDGYIVKMVHFKFSVA